MIIRFAEESDFIAWQTVAADVADIFGNPQMATDPDFIDYAKRKIKQREALTACDEGGDCVGFIGFSRTYGRITWLGVLSDFRNRGGGGLLLSAALAELDRTKEITVETYRDSFPEGRPARRVYLRHGFVETETDLFDHLGNERCKMVLPPQKR